MLLNVLVIVTLQISTPPPPLETPSHWVIEVIGCGEVDVVVVHVPAPAATGPAAPTQRVSVTEDGAEAVPLLVKKFWIVMVQESPWPPMLLAASLLHCPIGALSGAALT